MAETKTPLYVEDLIELLERVEQHDHALSFYRRTEDCIAEASHQVFDQDSGHYFDDVRTIDYGVFLDRLKELLPVPGEAADG